MTYVSESFWHDAVNKATTDLFTFGYKHIIKPNFVFNHRPDEAHDQMIEFCHVVKNVPPLLLAEQLMLDYTDPILETNVMGVDFTNPFGLSAGLDKNCDMPVVLDHAGFGFETVGSTTSRPARTRTSANRSPRLRKRSTVCLRRSTRSTARSPRWSRCR